MDVAREVGLVDHERLIEYGARGSRLPGDVDRHGSLAPRDPELREAVRVGRHGRRPTRVFDLERQVRERRVRVGEEA
jgi:hypothetical protein